MIATGDSDYCLVNHGGGKQCKIREGCHNKAVSVKGYCTEHGRGKRVERECQIDGCTEMTVSGDDVCDLHGAGSTCNFNGCTRKVKSGGDFC
jgi:hypothetical protein